MLFDWMYPLVVMHRVTRTQLFFLILMFLKCFPERTPAVIQPTCPFYNGPLSCGTTTQHAPHLSLNSWLSSSTTGEEDHRVCLITWPENKPLPLILCVFLYLESPPVYSCFLGVFYDPTLFLVFFLYSFILVFSSTFLFFWLLILFLHALSLFLCFFPRSQRLQFDVSSPNGILLFRETSKMITTYGEFSKNKVLSFVLMTFIKLRSTFSRPGPELQ